MGRAKEKIDEKKLSNWKLLDDFRQRLAKVRKSQPEREKRPGGPERLLLEEDYFSLMLFGLLNPVIDSMRGLCAASHLNRVQQEVCGRKVSLGSFSEAQGVFDPEVLRQVFLDLSGEVPASWGDARLAHLADKLKLVDGRELLLATDLEIEAELIALICRYRWQIELFFKWLKSILGCRHLMAESPEGRIRGQVIYRRKPLTALAPCFFIPPHGPSPFQSLYHFTVGGPQDDARIATL